MARGMTHYYGDACLNGHHEPDLFESFHTANRTEVWLDCPCGWKKRIEGTPDEVDKAMRVALDEHRAEKFQDGRLG